jgi:hypothetical protein
VPISKALMPFLRELHLQDYADECYVFGSPYKKGSKVDSTHQEYFKPSMKVKLDTVTKFWKRIVKIKLGIVKYLHAAKHTGADAKILAGMDLDTLRELYGYSSKLMTEKYPREVKKIRFNEIIEKSPGF